MRSGPKGAVSLEPLAWASRSKGVDKFRLFCKRYLKIPKGVGVGKPFVLRDWQVEAVRPVFEGGSKIHLIQIARGNGKSGLIAALGLYALFFGDEGGRIMTVAQNDLSARRLLRTAARMVELNDELLERSRSARAGQPPGGRTVKTCAGTFPARQKRPASNGAGGL